jgi:hypothetical protein
MAERLANPHRCLVKTVPSTERDGWRNGRGDLIGFPFCSDGLMIDDDAVTVKSARSKINISGILGFMLCFPHTSRRRTVTLSNIGPLQIAGRTQRLLSIRREQDMKELLESKIHIGTIQINSQWGKCSPMSHRPGKYSITVHLYTDYGPSFFAANFCSERGAVYQYCPLP